jgi:hypothetical protein
MRVWVQAILDRNLAHLLNMSRTPGLQQLTLLKGRACGRQPLATLHLLVVNLPRSRARSKFLFFSVERLDSELPTESPTLFDSLSWDKLAVTNAEINIIVRLFFPPRIMKSSTRHDRVWDNYFWAAI